MQQINNPKSIASLLLLLLCSVGLLAQEQEFKRDVKRMNETLMDNRFHIKMKYSLQGYTGSDAKQQMTAEYGRWGSMSYTKYEGVDGYDNDKYRVAVYHDMKRVVVNKPDRLKKKPLQDQLKAWEIFTDTLVKHYQLVKVMKREGSQKTYRVVYPATVKEYTHADIKIDTALNIPVSIKIYYKQNVGEILGSYLFQGDSGKDKPIVLIEYSDYRKLTENDLPSFYSTEVKVSATGKVELFGKLKNYKLDNFYSR